MAIGLKLRNLLYVIHTVPPERLQPHLPPGIELDLRDTPQVVGAWLANAPPDGASGWTRAELATHLREEYSTFSWLLEPMIGHAGFAIRAAQHSDSQTHSAYTCIKTS